MADAVNSRNKAQAALFEAIAAQVATVADSSVAGASRARMLADLALAYRYTAGGPQPGSLQVDAK